MLAKTKVVLIALCLALSFAILASPSWGKASDLTLKEVETGKEVKAGSQVPAGWYIALEPKEGETISCQLLEQKAGEELKEGAMTLTSNKSTKDKANGKVAAPRCYSAKELSELEERIKKEEEEKGPPSAIRSLRRATRVHTRRRADDVRSLTAPSSEGSGEMVLEEMDNNHKGTIELSKALVIHFEEGAVKCAYESKTKIKATWPPKFEGTGEEKKEEEEAFPNLEKTANLVTSAVLKLTKSSPKTGCAKTEEAFIEAWLGPLGEEFEAEL